MKNKKNKRKKWKKKKKKEEKERKKKKNKFFSLIEKNHKNIWKWKLSNGEVVGNFKRK